MWHESKEVQERCEDAILNVCSIANSTDRHFQALNAIDNLMLSLPPEVDVKILVATIVHAALHPDAYTMVHAEEIQTLGETRGQG